jgi:hypothetical protein
VTDPKYAAFTALDPFFDIVQQGLAGLVDADHYFTPSPTTRSLNFDIISPDGPRQFAVVTP